MLASVASGAEAMISSSENDCLTMIKHAKIPLSKSRVRVLLINHTAKLGGGELALAALVRHMDKSRIDHQVLLCEDGPLTDRLHSTVNVRVLPLSDKIREARKDTLGSGGLAQLKNMATLPLYVLRLRNEIRRLRVDLVHTNSLKADIIGGIAARLAGKPVIWHVRDRIECDYLPARVVQLFRLLARWIPHGIIANSHATLAALKLGENAGNRDTKKGAWKGRSCVIHDGFDFAEIKPPPPSSRHSIRIGLIGRISPWKGQDIFLLAAAIVHQRFPQARFEIIGSALFGEDWYEAKVRKLCSELHLDQYVHFVGFVDNVQEHINQLDIVVHASTIGEPFGQVVIEGMAARKPVVATRGGGIPEIVIHGQTGFLVPTGDSAAMAQAICSLLADPAQADAMGNSGYQRVLDHFRIEQTAANVSAFYQEVLSCAHGFTSC
jgi:glycosyltransferase involved in cell wall biosynthesis